MARPPPLLGALLPRARVLCGYRSILPALVCVVLIVLGAGESDMATLTQHVLAVCWSRGSSHL